MTASLMVWLVVFFYFFHFFCEALFSLLYVEKEKANLGVEGILALYNFGFATVFLLEHS